MITPSKREIYTGRNADPSQWTMVDVGHLLGLAGYDLVRVGDVLCPQGDRGFARFDGDWKGDPSARVGYYRIGFTPDGKPLIRDDLDDSSGFLSPPAGAMPDVLAFMAGVWAKAVDATARFHAEMVLEQSLASIARKSEG